MGDGMLSLSWNNHNSYFSHMLSSLRHLELYSDVTVSCDGEFYCVHKFVLSTCSDYFTKVFECTPCKHPVIILKDIKSKEMEALLNYMYIGQVSVAQSDLTSLIKAAELLQIRGLAVPDEPFKTFRKIPGQPVEKNGSAWKLWKKSGESMHGQDNTDAKCVSSEKKKSCSITAAALSTQNHSSNKICNINENTNHRNNEGVQAKSSDEIMSYASDYLQEHSKQANKDTNFDQNLNHGGLMQMSGNSQRDVAAEDEGSLEIPDLSYEGNQPIIHIEEEDGEISSIFKKTANIKAGNDGLLTSDASNEIDFDEETEMDDICFKEEDVIEEHFDISDVGSESSQLQHPGAKEECSFPENKTKNLNNQPGTFQCNMMKEVFEGQSRAISEANFEEVFQNPFQFLPSSAEAFPMSPEYSLLKGKTKKPYGCPQCLYRTSTKSNLATHMRSHTGERPFACTLCTFTASYEYNLKVHMRTHTGEKPYLCPHCPQKFTQKSHLNNHIYTHTGEKPYGCDHCTMKFSRRSNLRRHLMKHK